MIQEHEALTRELAAALWRSGPPFRNLDRWLAAERMISQAAAARRAGVAEPKPPRSLTVSAAPVGRIRDLAYALWDRAGRPAGMALSFWLAAERHVHTMCRAFLAGATATDGSFSAAAHCARLGGRARHLWERAGRPDGRDVEFWLAAEIEVLASASAEDLSVRRSTTGSAEAWPT